MLERVVAVPVDGKGLDVVCVDKIFEVLTMVFVGDVWWAVVVVVEETHISS